MSSGLLYQHDMVIDPSTGHPCIAWVDDSAVIRCRVWNGTEFVNPIANLDPTFGAGAVDVACAHDGTNFYLAYHNPDGIIGVTFVNDGINVLATTEGEAPLGPGNGALISIAWHSSNGGIMVGDVAIDGMRCFFYYSGSWVQLGSDGDIEALGGGLQEGSLAAFAPKFYNSGATLIGAFTYWAEGIGMQYRTALWGGSSWSLLTTDDTWCTLNGTDVAPAFATDHVEGDEASLITLRCTSDGGSANIIRMSFVNGDGWFNDPSNADLAYLIGGNDRLALTEGSLSISQHPDTGNMVAVANDTDGNVYAMISDTFYGENTGWTFLGRVQGAVTANIAGGTETLNAGYPVVLWDWADDPLRVWMLLRTSDGKLQVRRVELTAP
jgi:hypothetical protein